MPLRRSEDEDCEDIESCYDWCIETDEYAALSEYEILKRKE